MSLALVSASPYVMSSSFSSASTDRRQVVLGLPLGLFPWGVHLRKLSLLYWIQVSSEHAPAIRSVFVVFLSGHVAGLYTLYCFQSYMRIYNKLFSLYFRIPMHTREEPNTTGLSDVIV